MSELANYVGEVLCKCGFKHPESLMRIEDLEEITSINRRYIYDLIDDGSFPKPFKIKGNYGRHYWYKSEITNWICSLKGESNGNVASDEAECSPSHIPQRRRMEDHAGTSRAFS
jgi:predicted DNA-binding transcriptional regulator AlpA